jgi:hypothetical protein
MDELGGFEPTDTTGFIQIESIRIKKCVAYRLVMIRTCYLSTFTSDGRRPISAKARLASNQKMSMALAFRLASTTKRSVSNVMLCSDCCRQCMF